MLVVREYPKKLLVLYFYTVFTPTFQYFYTDISAISVTFRNSAYLMIVLIALINFIGSGMTVSHSSGMSLRYFKSILDQIQEYSNT